MIISIKNYKYSRLQKLKSRFYFFLLPTLAGHAALSRGGGPHVATIDLVRWRLLRMVAGSQVCLLGDGSQSR